MKISRQRETLGWSESNVEYQDSETGAISAAALNPASTILVLSDSGHSIFASGHTVAHINVSGASNQQLGGSCGGREVAPHEDDQTFR